jgi:hypothetical protein
VLDVVDRRQAPIPRTAIIDGEVGGALPEAHGAGTALEEERQPRLDRRIDPLGERRAHQPCPPDVVVRSEATDDPLLARPGDDGVKVIQERPHFRALLLEHVADRSKTAEARP